MLAKILASLLSCPLDVTSAQSVQVLAFCHSILHARKVSPVSLCLATTNQPPLNTPYFYNRLERERAAHTNVWKGLSRRCCMGLLLSLEGCFSPPFYLESMSLLVRSANKPSFPPSHSIPPPLSSQPNQPPFLAVAF